MREKRLTRVFAVRFDRETADFLKAQPDPSAFVREAVKEAIVKGQADSANADSQVVAWHAEVQSLQRELDEIRAGKDAVGLDLTGTSMAAKSEEDEDVTRRVYDAYKGREFAIKQRIADLNRKILQA